MDEIPDITGYSLDKALAICKMSGYEVEVVVTRPVKAIPEDRPRVVRFNKVSKNRGVVTVVFEDSGRGGG